MPLCKAGAFNITTGAASSTVQVSGVGFTPKVVLFWFASGRTESTDAAGRANIRKGFGYAISTSDRRACSARSTDASGSAISGSGDRDDCCIFTITAAEALEGQADLSSMDSDGFTLVIDVAFGADLRIEYMALGGDDLTNYIGGILTEHTTTGDQDITSLSFQPDCVIFFSGHIAAAPPGIIIDSKLMIGAAAGASIANCVTSGGSNDGANTMQTIYHSNDDECIGLLAAAVTSADGRAAVTSWLSNGFRLNWAERASTRRIQYIALKGGGYKIGSLTGFNNVGNTTQVTGIGFPPLGGMILSGYASETAGDTVAATDALSIGAFNSPTSRVATHAYDEDGIGTSICDSQVEHDACYCHMHGTSAAFTIVDIQSLDVNGVTFMTDLGGITTFIWYLMFGGEILTMNSALDIIAETRMNPGLLSTAISNIDVKLETSLSSQFTFNVNTNIDNISDMMASAGFTFGAISSIDLISEISTSTNLTVGINSNIDIKLEVSTSSNMILSAISKLDGISELNIIGNSLYSIISNIDAKLEINNVAGLLLNVISPLDTILEIQPFSLVFTNISSSVDLIAESRIFTTNLVSATISIDNIHENRIISNVTRSMSLGLDNIIESRILAGNLVSVLIPVDNIIETYIASNLLFNTNTAIDNILESKSVINNLLSAIAPINNIAETKFTPSIIFNISAGLDLITDITAQLNATRPLFSSCYAISEISSILGNLIVVNSSLDHIGELGISASLVVGLINIEASLDHIVELTVEANKLLGFTSSINLVGDVNIFGNMVFNTGTSLDNIIDTKISSNLFLNSMVACNCVGEINSIMSRISYLISNIDNISATSISAGNLFNIASNLNNIIEINIYTNQIIGITSSLYGQGDISSNFNTIFITNSTFDIKGELTNILGLQSGLIASVVGISELGNVIMDVFSGGININGVFTLYLQLEKSRVLYVEKTFVGDS